MRKDNGASVAHRQIQFDKSFFFLLCSFVVVAFALFKTLHNHCNVAIFFNCNSFIGAFKNLQKPQALKIVNLPF